MHLRASGGKPLLGVVVSARKEGELGKFRVRSTFPSEHVRAHCVYSPGRAIMGAVLWGLAWGVCLWSHLLYVNMWELGGAFT